MALPDSQDMAPLAAQDMAPLETQDIALLETQDMALLEPQDVAFLGTQDLALLLAGPRQLHLAFQRQKNSLNFILNSVQKIPGKLLTELLHEFCSKISWKFCHIIQANPGKPHQI